MNIQKMRDKSNVEIKVQRERESVMMFRGLSKDTKRKYQQSVKRQGSFDPMSVTYRWHDLRNIA